MMFNKRTFIVALALLTMVTPTMSAPAPDPRSLVCSLCEHAVGFIISYLNKTGAKPSAEELAVLVCAGDHWNPTGIICNAVVFVVAEYVLKEVAHQVEHHYHLDGHTVCHDVSWEGHHLC